MAQTLGLPPRHFCRGQGSRVRGSRNGSFYRSVPAFPSFSKPRIRELRCLTPISLTTISDLGRHFFETLMFGRGELIDGKTAM